MTKTKNVSHFVAISDLSKPVDEQEGILLEVNRKGGDTEKNRAEALSIINQMWEEGKIEDNKFPDGVSDENIFYVPPEKDDKKDEKKSDPNTPLLPIVQGAREIVELTKLQVEVQEAAEETAPYTSIMETILDRSRPLTSEEKDLAKNKKYGKVIERFGLAIAQQEEYQEKCTGNGKMLLNAIAWQLSQTKKIDSDLKEEE